MFIDDKERYMKLGLATKKVFTDEEYVVLPNISVLYKLYTDYEKLLNQKQSAETTLANAEAHNINLPNNESEITQYENLIAAIDGATLLEQVQYKEARAEYLAEKERLETEQTAIDTAPIQAKIDNLTSQITAKETEITDECTALGIEAIING